jgi:hypothetical protein
MLSAMLIAEKVSETQIIGDNSVDFMVYETSHLDVLYRWGIFENKFIGLQNFSRHQMDIGKNHNANKINTPQEAAKYLINTY